MAIISTATTASLQYFRRGVQAPSFLTARGADFQRLKDEGRDHCSVVIVPDLVRGGGAPLIFPQERIDDLLIRIDLAHAKGLRVDVKHNPWRDQLKAAYLDESWGRFDESLVQICQALNTCDLTRTRLEILPEPGWLFSLTDPLPHAEGRKVATAKLESFWRHAVPLCASRSRVTLLLGSAGYGHLVGPGEFQDIKEFHPNCVNVCRFYWPHPVTHYGKAYPGAPADNVEKYQTGALPWNRDGMRQALMVWKNLAAPRKHISESQPLPEYRFTPSGTAWRTDFTELCAELGLSYTFWDF